MLLNVFDINTCIIVLIITCGTPSSTSRVVLVSEIKGIGSHNNIHYFTILIHVFEILSKAKMKNKITLKVSTRTVCVLCLFDRYNSITEHVPSRYISVSNLVEKDINALSPELMKMCVFDYATIISNRGRQADRLESH